MLNKGPYTSYALENFGDVSYIQNTKNKRQEKTTKNNRRKNMHTKLAKHVIMHMGGEGGGQRLVTFILVRILYGHFMISN